MSVTSSKATGAPEFYLIEHTRSVTRSLPAHVIRLPRCIPGCSQSISPLDKTSVLHPPEGVSSHQGPPGSQDRRTGGNRGHSPGWPTRANSNMPASRVSMVRNTWRQRPTRANRAPSKIRALRASRWGQRPKRAHRANSNMPASRASMIKNKRRQHPIWAIRATYEPAGPAG